MSSEEMPGLERPYNHRLSLSHLGEDKNGHEYRVLSKLRSYKAYTERIEIMTNKGPMMKTVFREETSHVEVTICDFEGEECWYGILYASKYNVSRKRQGGRDDTWEKEEFDLIVLDAIQNPFENEGMTYEMTIRDDGRLHFEIKDTKESGKVVKLLKNCFLDRAPPEITTPEKTIKLVIDILTDHLCIACRIGDLEHAEKMLEELGASPHYGSFGEDDLSYWPPLHLACHFGHLDVVKWLIDDHEVDVSHETPDGMKPVQIAARRGYPEIVNYLIKSGADHELKTINDESLSDLGIKHGHRDIVDIFYGAGGLHRHIHAPRPKTPLECMFQLGPFDGIDGYKEDQDVYPDKRMSVRFPWGLDRRSYKEKDYYADEY